MYYIELLTLGLIDGSMYALMAIGLTMIYGLLRVLHVAHAGVFVLGAFVGVFVTNATEALFWVSFWRFHLAVCSG